MATFRVLGCSGGIGDVRRTSSFLVNDTTLIDAGTGVGDLSLESLCGIDRVFLTHSHLDHVSHLPFLLDSVQGTRSGPVTVHGLEPTLQALKDHIFNERICPDFSVIPSPQAPCMVYSTVQVLDRISLTDGVCITPIPAEHSIQACGYHLHSENGGVVYTGDSVCNRAFWAYVNACTSLTHLVIETSFLNAEQSIADRSFHLTPNRLASEIAHMSIRPQLHITHLKPGSERQLMDEIGHALAPLQARRLMVGDVLQF